MRSGFQVQFIGVSEGVEATLVWDGSLGQYVFLQEAPEDPDIGGECFTTSVPLGEELVSALAFALNMGWVGVEIGGISREEFLNVSGPVLGELLGDDEGLSIDGVWCEMRAGVIVDTSLS